MHAWIPSQIDNKKCAKCARTYIVHLAPVCESCGKMDKECEIFGRMDNPRALLLCPPCTANEVTANSITIHKTQILIENPPFASLALTGSEELIKQAQEIDGNIRYNGDVFNAKTVAFAKLKEMVMADESLGTIQERTFKYQNLIAERLQHLKQVVFKLDNEKHDAISEQMAARESLREYGASLREEIRNKIKESDANYTPHQIIKTPKVAAPKKSAMDRLVEAYSLMHGISKESAKELIERGQGK